MRRPWPVYVAGVLLVIALAWIKTRASRRPIEHFGLFSPSKIQYSDLITAMFTPKELKTWQTNMWDPMTLDEKNATIATWDALAAADQKKQYDMYLAQKNARLNIENAGTASVSQ
jgi:hypothetical protein